MSQCGNALIRVLLFLLQGKQDNELYSVGMLKQGWRDVWL